MKEFLCFFVLMPIIFIGFAILASHAQQADRDKICKGTTIASVGGCSASGRCGVMLSDGREYEVFHPVVGGPCR